MLTNTAKTISFVDAKAIAEDMAYSDLKSFVGHTQKSRLLQDRWLEAEHCWIFFRTKEYNIPPEMWFIKNYCAYAISKKGTARSITDFSDNPERLQAYLQTMSNYFKVRDE